MDSFVVSARKYRPATFNTVVGQESITTTLKNAIRSNHLAQAFLFCGPRGVGKTTCARILAKTINCTNLGADTEGCNQCESCISFNNGQSLNIFELDAASNNSVDDIRNLVDQVRYPPQSGKYKIYIIDEVHMLTTSAFNAFLKTLEEPPPYAIFILATTEKHKIIPTILSRCQIFDFNRITIKDIASHLVWIAGQEQVNAEPEALHLIAQKADGALRDALSIFDQIVSFASDEVTYKHVIENLNILDYEYYFRITDCLQSGDYPSVLLILDEIIRDGFDVHHFIAGLASHFRDLLVCKDPQTIALLEVGETTKKRYLDQAQQLSPGLLFRYLDLANRCDIEFRSSQNQRLLTELSLLKMCSQKDQEVFAMPALADPSSKKKVNSVAPVIPGEPMASTTNSPTATTAPPSTMPVVATVDSGSATKSANKKGPSSRFSISSSPSQVSETEAPVVRAIRDQPFDEKAVRDSLQQCVDKLMQAGRKNLAVTLNRHKAVLLDHYLIEIPVDNNVQADEIQLSKSELLHMLRENLQNDLVDLQHRVLDDNEVEPAAYTPAEKYSQMVKKNPDLNHLRQQFDLELDY